MVQKYSKCFYSDKDACFSRWMCNPRSPIILEWILVIIVEERVQNVSQAGGESVRQAGTALKPIHNQVKVGEFNLYSPLQYKVRRSCAPSFILFDVWTLNLPNLILILFGLVLREPTY